MAKNDILSIRDIDAFLERVRATVAAAQETQALKEALSRLIRGTEVAAPAPVPTGARGRRGRVRRRRGRGARVTDQTIVELLQNAPGGLGIRDLQAELKQHPETIRLKLRNLRREGLVETTGPRNQLRYHAAGGAGVAAEEKAAPRARGRAKAARGGRRRRGRGARGARGGGFAGGAAPSEGFADQVLLVVRGGGGDGVQMSTLSSELRADPKTIRKVLETLREAGHIEVTGHRRSTRYHALG